MPIEKEQYTIGNLFKKIINDKIAKIHTSIPAEIVKVNSNNTVDVRPLIKDYNLKKEYVELPVISDVPLQFFRNSIALISIPVNIGDSGTLTFSERSIKNWQLQGGSQNPEDNRRFNLTDCYFCPDIMKDGDGKSIDSNLNIILNNSSIKIKANGDINIESSGNINMTGISINNEATNEINNTNSIGEMNIDSSGLLQLKNASQSLFTLLDTLLTTLISLKTVDNPASPTITFFLDSATTVALNTAKTNLALLLKV